MKRRLPGLSEVVQEPHIALPDGVYLVRIASAQYRWYAQKPFYGLRLSILEPQQFKEREIVSRLYCTPKAMWKLGWFLRDFIYDPELLSQNEVDERALRGLVRVVKISHAVINGIRLVNLGPPSRTECFSSGLRVSNTAGMPRSLSTGCASRSSNRSNSRSVKSPAASTARRKRCGSWGGSYGTLSTILSC